MYVIVLQCLCEACAVAADALDAGEEYLPEALRPPQGDVIAGRGRGELGIAERLAAVGQGGDVDGLEVGIDADDDAACRCHDGGVLSVN